jgi:diacylglycerol kinase (ATP)
VAESFPAPALLLTFGFALKRLYNATINSLRGIADGVRTEPAIREEAIVLAVALLLGVVVAPSMVWYVAMIGVLLILLAIEFLNTGIEKLADHVTPEQHDEIRRIKDFGSAAVFCGLCLTALVWFAALAVRFWPA